jgi:hypothetical protein
MTSSDSRRESWLRSVWKRLTSSGQNGQPKPAPRLTKDEALHTSVVLDRLLQWHTLVDACRSREEHLAFVVHGTEEQDLHLFMERIHRHLSEESRVVYRVRKVQRTSDGTTASTLEEWQRCLVQATQARTGEPDFFLADEATKVPVLFLFADADGPLQNLDTEATEGLVRLLASRVSPALASLTAQKKIRNPVRFVIPIEHPQSGPPGDPAVKALTDGLTGRPGLRLEPVVELGFPMWSDVLHHIGLSHPSADTAVQTKCHAIYNEVAAAPDRSLLRLGNALHEVLFSASEKSSYKPE